MPEKNPEELLAIDVQRFRAFYGHFEDGRSAAESGVKRFDTQADRLGAPHLRIQQHLRNKLGQPHNRDYWLGSKSVLEDWKRGKSPPRPRERKVLQAIYDEWRFDISVNQEFSDRIVVESPVAELLEVEGVTLEPAGPDKFLLKLERLELFRKVRPVKDEAGRPMGSSAELGFSEVLLVVEFPEESDAANDGDKAYKIILDTLSSGQPSKQTGIALGMNVLVDSKRPAWRLYAAPRINGRLQRAQLIDLFDRSIDELRVRVEVAKADFNPVVFLDDPSGDRKKDTEEKEKATRQLQAQILLQRLKADDDRFTLASGRIARR
jgi:hypothetical protein